MAAIFAYPFGRLSDKIGRKNMLCTGYFLYGVVYLGIGLYAAIVGFGLLPASIIAGSLWDLMGQSTPFIFGGILAFITSVGVFITLGKMSNAIFAKN